MIQNLGPSIRTKYEFSADVLDIIISGKSTIDSPTAFQIQNLAEVDNFIQSYGYDLNNPIENAEVVGNFHEALNFIRKNFLQPDNPDGLKIEIPRKILELTDTRELFLMVSLKSPGQTSNNQGLFLRNWACSILKVMHTISHIDKDLRSIYFTDIQKQIFDRFYKLVHRDPEGPLFLGENSNDPFRINLVAFETKPKKSRNSIILKLLHKPENVAEDIFDRVGIRFTTLTPLDALRVVKFLKDKMVVMSANIKPSRSRNTLVEISDFRAQLESLLNQADQHKMNESEFLAKLETAARAPFVNPENPHSSEFYRAIQFTGRQLIKLRNPIFDELKELKNLVKTKPTHEEILKTVDRIDLKYIQREIRFFYPFEVQVVDKQSSEENERGRSAHSKYKKAQVLTAMNRVMGSLADAVR